MTPAALDFGTLTVGQTTTLAMVMENVGDAPLVTETEQIVGDAGSSFWVADFFGRLDPGQIVGNTVSFTPTQPGVLAADLFIQDDGNPLPFLIPLTGTGVSFGVVADPMALDFGAVPLGTTASLRVLFSAIGLAPVTLKLDATNLAPEFTLATTGSPSQALPTDGGVLAVTVTFAPTNATVNSAFSFQACDSSDTCVSPQPIAVAGTELLDGGADGG